MIHDDGHRDLARRVRDGLDPLLPASGVEQRLMSAVRERIDTINRPRPAWLRPFQTTLGGALVAVSVVVLVGGALGLTLALRGKPVPRVPAVTPVVPVVPPIAPSPTPPATPSPTSSTPGTIAYVQPGSVSFASATNGWVAGSACDAQNRCETGIARTTDGGVRWSLVSTPVDANGLSLSITAASSEDAWIWGIDGNETGIPPILAATHDAGRTWQQFNLAGATVVDVQAADGTAWAQTGCASGATLCTARLVSQPGARWRMDSARSGPQCGAGPRLQQRRGLRSVPRALRHSRVDHRRQ